MSLLSAMEYPLPKIVSLPSQRALRSDECSVQAHPGKVKKILEEMATIQDEDRGIVGIEGDKTGAQILAHPKRAFVRYNYTTRKKFRRNPWEPSPPLFLDDAGEVSRTFVIALKGERRFNIFLSYHLDPRFMVLQPKEKFGFTHGLYLQRQRTGKPDEFRRYVLLAR